MSKRILTFVGLALWTLLLMSTPAGTQSIDRVPQGGSGGGSSNSAIGYFEIGDTGKNPASSGTLRLPHGGTVSARNNADNANAPLVSWGVDAPNELRVGDGSTNLRLATNLNSPSSPAEGEWWVECQGSSPSRICAIKIQDGGVARVVAQTTF